VKPFDRSLDADVQEQIDLLEAALRGDADADPTLSALVDDVRATRPTLGAGARERLEARARASSDGAGDARTAPRVVTGFGRRRWRLALALGAVVAVAVPVSGLVLREESAVVVSEMASRAEQPDDAIVATDSRASRAQGDPVTESRRPSTSAASPASGTSLTQDRSVVREARQVVRVEASAVAASAGRVSEIVADHGGYLDASSVSETGSSPRADFAIVVPSDRLDATIAAIGRIGKPVELERMTSDVTAQRSSIDDRLRDLRADRSAVRLQLARATDADRRASKRRELRVLSSRVARLEAEQRELRQRVDTARLSLQLVTSDDGAAASPTGDDDRWGLSTAWHDAGRVLEVIGGILLLAAVALIPLAAVLGLAAVAIGRLTATRKNRTIGEA
jgi:hypothetical protein